MHFFDGQISLHKNHFRSTKKFLQKSKEPENNSNFFPLKTAVFGRLPFLGKLPAFIGNLSAFRKIITSANKIPPENQWLENDITFLGPGQFSGYLWKKENPLLLIPFSQEAQFIDLQGKSCIFKRFLHLSTTKATWIFFLPTFGKK